MLDSCATTSKMKPYDGLSDQNLVEYLSSKRVRKQLVRQGLVTPTQITKEGAVVDKRGAKLLPSQSANILGVKERFVKSKSPERNVSKKKFKKQVIKPLTSSELKEVIAAHQNQFEESKRPALPVTSAKLSTASKDGGKKTLAKTASVGSSPSKTSAQPEGQTESEVKQAEPKRNPEVANIPPEAIHAAPEGKESKDSSPTSTHPQTSAVPTGPQPHAIKDAIPGEGQSDREDEMAEEVLSEVDEAVNS